MKNKTKLIINKLKIFSYDSIFYKTKMVLKKWMHKHRTTKAVKYEVYETLPNIYFK